MEHTTILPTERVSAPIAVPGTLPPAPVVMAILDRFNRTEIGNTIEVLVALLDIWDGDGDAEEVDAEDSFELTAAALNYDTRPGCFIGDAGDVSATEWHTRRAHDRERDGITGKDGWRLHEDSEDDDPDHGQDEGEPNFARIAMRHAGPGCEISDEGGCQHDGREPDVDMEQEQMQGDVPMLPVVSQEYNVFSDQRTALGISNLQTSFRTNTEQVRSADSGATWVTRYEHTLRPGVPV